MIGITDGPWRGDATARHPAWTLTLGELERFLRAIPDRDGMLRALGVERLSDRKADRALQLLRQAGLIRWQGSKMGWMRTGLGEREAQRS